MGEVSPHYSTQSVSVRINKKFSKILQTHRLVNYRTLKYFGGKNFGKLVPKICLVEKTLESWVFIQKEIKVKQKTLR